MKTDYEEKNVLVTGGAGFIGSTLVRRLIESGANVTVMDNLSHGKPENLSGKDLELVRGDIRDRQLVDKIVSDKDLVFHLVAKPFIPYCYVDPREVLEVNLMGTLNVLETVKSSKIENLVYISTSEVYGSAQYTPMDEKHPTLPHSTYAVSKLAADRLCSMFHREHGIPVSILRIFNAYGPRETHPYIIPEAISQLSKSDVVYFGDLNSTRDFTFVEDTVKAILLSGLNPLNGEVLNVGSGKGIKMLDIVKLIAKLLGKDDIEIKEDPSKFRVFDVDTLLCDNKKAKKLLKWEPKIELEEGLKKTIDWFLQNGKKWPWEKK